MKIIISGSLISILLQVKEWKRCDINVPMCTARPGWKAMTLREPQYKKTMYNVHINLDQILELNIEKQVTYLTTHST